MGAIEVSLTERTVTSSERRHLEHTASNEEVHLSSCQECGASRPLPSFETHGISPLFDMRLAAYLIPMRYDTLKKWLHRHRETFPPLYRLQGRMHRRIRLLSGNEIKLIRALALRGKTSARAEEIAIGATTHSLINMPREVEPSCALCCPESVTVTPGPEADLHEQFDDDEENGIPQDQQPLTKETV